jgi:hypothetical protein
MEATSVLLSARMAGTKRKHGDDSPDTVYTNKLRSRPSGEARIDPTYGQRSAIPGLDDDTIMEGESDDLNYDEEMDALTYLRSVRLVNLVRVRGQERGRTWLRLDAV